MRTRKYTHLHVIQQKFKKFRTGSQNNVLQYFEISVIFRICVCMYQTYVYILTCVYIFFLKFFVISFKEMRRVQKLSRHNFKFIS